MTARESVTVVIPCYNAEQFVLEAIQSVLEQTVPLLEILVVDDGSEDHSVDLIRQLDSHLVRLIQQEHAGESVARNRGINEAKGDWIAFLDADDIWRHDKLEVQLAVAQTNPALVCVHSQFYFLGARSGVPPVPAAVMQGDYSVETLIRTALVNSSTALVLRSACPRFPEWTSHGEDMIFFAELGAKGPFVFVSEPLAGYRKHRSSQTSSPSHQIKNFESRERWVRDLAPISREARAELLAALIMDLDSEAELAKYRRNWPRYWDLRRYLASRPDTAMSPTCSERILPPLAYRIKDMVDDAREWVYAVLSAPAANTEPVR